MNRKHRAGTAGLLGICAALGVAAAAPAPSLAPAGEQLQAQYATALKDVQAELTKAVPPVNEPKKAAFLAAREAVGKAQAEVAAAQAPFDKIEGAEGLVGHRKGK